MLLFTLPRGEGMCAIMDHITVLQSAGGAKRCIRHLGVRNLWPSQHHISCGELLPALPMLDRNSCKLNIQPAHPELCGCFGLPSQLSQDPVLCQGCVLYLQCGVDLYEPYDPSTGTLGADVPYPHSTVYQTPAPANAQLPWFLSVEDTNIQLHDNTGKTVFCAFAGDPSCNTSG